MLRAARPADLDDLLTLERECFRTDRLTRLDFARLLLGRRTCLLVMSGRGGALGYALLRLPGTRGIARIESLAVARRARGRGLAHRLATRCVRLASRARATRVRLEVRPGNRAARRLYRTLGFATLQRLPRYYADGGPGLRLELRLDPSAHRKRAASG